MFLKRNSFSQDKAEQSKFDEKSIIYLFSQENRKNIITLSNILIFLVCMIRNKSPNFYLSVGVNGIIIRFI